MKHFITKFAKRYSILFSILVCVITLIISSLFSWDEYPVMGFDKLTGDLLISIFCLVLIQILGILPGARIQRAGFSKGLRHGIPLLVIGILGAVIGNLGTDFSVLSMRSIGFILLFTMNMFLVGVNEELLMRGLILNHFLQSKKVPQAIILSAVIFGAIHLPNMFFFDPITVIVQAVNAAAAGVLFAVIFIISENLWSVIVVHMLVDWLSLFLGQCMIGGASVISVDMTVGQGMIMILLGSVPPLIIALIYYKRDAIGKYNLNP